MVFIQPVTLNGELVSLEPLDVGDHDELVEAARDGELWTLSYTSVPGPDGMRGAVEHWLTAQASGTILPFTVRQHPTRRVIGMTSFCNIDADNRHVEIGGTWNARSAHRSGANTESKLLLLGHAFDQLDCIAVEFRTHWLNQQSRRAIERLGAKQDGVLRSHKLMPDGTLRDTIAFSIIAAEWPAIHNELSRRLARYACDPARL